MAVISHVKSKLQQLYQMKDLGVIDEILGCKVCVDKDLDCITSSTTTPGPTAPRAPRA